MGVELSVYAGYTVTIATDLVQADWDKFDKFIEDNPQYDEYNPKPTQVKLITDGMNGSFARLFMGYIIKDVYELDYMSISGKPTNEEVYKAFDEPYFKLFGEHLDKDLIEFAVWSLWW